MKSAGASHCGMPRNCRPVNAIDGGAVNLRSLNLALAAAVLILIVTAGAARNIPGLLEITILRHLKLDAGARYALAAVTQYAITIFGLSMAFSRVGVGWKDVQWLAADQWFDTRDACEVGVFGSFPLMVSGASAAVWARQHDFRANHFDVRHGFGIHRLVADLQGFR